MHHKQPSGRSPVGLPSLSGELANRAVQTGCRARPTRAFSIMSCSLQKSMLTCREGLAASSSSNNVALLEGCVWLTMQLWGVHAVSVAYCHEGAACAAADAWDPCGMPQKLKCDAGLHAGAALLASTDWLNPC